MTEFPNYPDNVTPTNKLQFFIARKDGSMSHVDGGLIANKAGLPTPGDGKMVTVNNREVGCVVERYAFTPHLDYTWTIILREL